MTTTIKVIELQREIFKSLHEIASREQFPECLEILKRYENGAISLSEEDAQRLVDCLGFEANRLTLKYPYTDEHPNYDDDGADSWSEFCQSLLPHAIGVFKEHFRISE